MPSASAQHRTEAARIASISEPIQFGGNAPDAAHDGVVNERSDGVKGSTLTIHNSLHEPPWDLNDEYVLTPNGPIRK
jgi:hypothetical protein